MTKSFWDEAREAFREETAKVETDRSNDLVKDIAEGVIKGTVETAAHPFRWLRTLTKG